MRVNTSDFEQDGDVQKLRLEAVAMLSSLQQRLSLCSCKCPRCFLRCIQERSHPGDHSCRSDHKCTQHCTYCADDILKSPDSAGHIISKCSDSAGHQGPHDCQEKAHTCCLDCSYWGSASNCNKVCTLKVKHTGDHKCNSRQHMCQSICSLPCCNNPCVIPFDLGEHDLHACHEKMCPEKCTVQGCQRNCASKDHFHSEEHHFCGDEHSCQEQCEAHGICEILTEVVKKTRTFQGNRGTFEYEHVSEQNGIRKTCCIAIPPNQVRSSAYWPQLVLLSAFCSESICSIGSITLICLKCVPICVTQLSSGNAPRSAFAYHQQQCSSLLRNTLPCMWLLLQPADRPHRITRHQPREHEGCQFRIGDRGH